MSLAGLQHAGSSPASAAEQTLLDFARRASRQPPMLALVLHLSGLRPPAPRPHHLRIARAVLHEVAERYGGQVVGLGCGDLVLLCPQPEAAPPGWRPQLGRGAADGASPSELPAFLERLLRIDAPEPDRLVSLWPLPGMAVALLSYATARSIAPHPGPAPTSVPTPAPMGRLPRRESGRHELERANMERAEQTAMLDALGAAAEAADIADVLHRQTAVLLPSSAADRGMLQPLFREISFSVTALEARIGGGIPARADPYLFRHLTGRLDRRMLEIMAAARGSGGPLDPGEPGPVGRDRDVGRDIGREGGPPLHLNLGLEAIASPAFAGFAPVFPPAREGRPAESCGGIEVSLMEACADPAAFHEARALVQAAGLLMVLDRVSHLALGMAEIAPLQPDLVKLEWSQAMARLEPPESGRLDATLVGIGAGHVVLMRADTEAAVRWGMARGIRRFQGRHVDAMLAASRLAACAHAGGCTLRQCTERAEAAAEAGRRFCRNTRLLDAATPGQAASPAPLRELA